MIKNDKSCDLNISFNFLLLQIKGTKCDKLKSGGLHEKHAAALAISGTISASAWRQRETKGACRSQDLPDCTLTSIQQAGKQKMNIA